MKKAKTLVDPRNARGPNYKRVMKEIISSGACPLCPKTMKWHTKPILKRSEEWYITENFAPYKNAKHHLLIIGKKHKENLVKLSAGDLRSILRLVAWATKKLKIGGGGVVIRFGDTLLTGATVKHIHCHLITPIVQNRKALPVYFPIG